MMDYGPDNRPYTVLMAGKQNAAQALSNAIVSSTLKFHHT
jgi:hypothetical protein